MSIFLWWVELPKKWEVEFEPEVQEYLDLKSQSTAHAYSNSFARFLEFYQSKYGKDANFGHFLDRIFEERKKPRREQKRIAEIEVSQFIDFLKDKGLSNNTIRMYFAAVQNFLKWKEVTKLQGGGGSRHIKFGCRFMSG
jgi:hypothetical protein